MAGRGAAAKSGLYAGWRVTDYSRHSWVYLLELLRFPRQSSNWRGISLMEHSWIKRLLWLAAIWGASVLALGAVSMIFRLLMNAAGLRA